MKTGNHKMTKLQPNSWTITLEEDPETGDLIMPIPQEVLDLQNWNPGDVLTWKDNQNGTWSLYKKIDVYNEKSV